MEKIVIFGDSFHGRAICRKYMHGNDKKILAILDNNPEKKGQYFSGIPITLPGDLSLDKDCSYYLAGRYVAEQKKQLVSLGVQPRQITLIHRQSLIPTDEELELRDGRIFKILSLINSLCTQLGIEYRIHKSGLLSLARGNCLAMLSDVDVIIDSKSFRIFLSAAAEYFEAKDRSLLIWHTGDNRFVIVDRKFDEKVVEPALVDVCCAEDEGIHLSDVTTQSSVDYFGLQLPVPLDYESWLSVWYGKKWREVEGFWKPQDS